MTAPFTIDRVDHFVLTVKDIDKTCEFYVSGLGMTRQDFKSESGTIRTALKFGRHKINLHPYPSPIEPKGANSVTGSGDFCLITEAPIDTVKAHLESLGVEIEIDTSIRQGAMGPIRSIYFRDPDKNLVEVSNYVAD
ncbi:MAG: VOC family protein [Rhodospirillaceae bacterium]